MNKRQNGTHRLLHVLTPVAQSRKIRK